MRRSVQTKLNYVAGARESTKKNVPAGNVEDHDLPGWLRRPEEQQR